MKNRVLLLIFSACLLFVSCREDSPFGIYDDPCEFTGWDTSIVLESIRIPDDEMLMRSLLNAGDTNHLKTFLNKISTGQEIKIGFIGGSITAGVNASAYHKSYPLVLCEFLNKTFTGPRFVPIERGVGSTGSRFGCSRIDDDLILLQPDLIVVDFAVNDYIGDSTEIVGSMEGIVRKCHHAGIEVMLLFMMYRYGNAIVQNLHRAIGEYYNVPVISYEHALKPMIQGGLLNWSTFSADDIHPNDNGHLAAALLLYKFIRSCYVGLNAEKPHEIEWKSCLYTDIYQFASVLKMNDLPGMGVMNSGWTIVTKEHNRAEFVSAHAGDALSFTASWREMTMMYTPGPYQCGMLEISVDGHVADTISDYDQTGNTYTMKKTKIFCQTVLTEHAISIRNLKNEPFRLNYILYSR